MWVRELARNIHRFASQGLPNDHRNGLDFFYQSFTAIIDTFFWYNVPFNFRTIWALADSVTYII